MLFNYLENLNKMRIQLGIILLFLISLTACNNNTYQATDNDTPELEAGSSLEKANRYLVRSEEEDIDDFLKRYKWEMTKTGTGLRYMIQTENSGPTIQYGQLVSLHYKIRFLNGNLVYSSDELGPKTFIAGRGGVETGLEEAIKLLKQGDKAKFILPSHLAFGLLGDGDKIPAKTPIIYEIDSIEIL